jgi:hypothetical protein
MKQYVASRKNRKMVRFEQNLAMPAPKFSRKKFLTNHH